MVICNYCISTSEKCSNANIPQIYYFKPEKEKDRKVTASFLSKSINIITAFALRKNVKQFARECILKLFKIQNKRVYP